MSKSIRRKLIKKRKLIQSRKRRMYYIWIRLPTEFRESTINKLIGGIRVDHYHEWSKINKTI